MFKVRATGLIGGGLDEWSPVGMSSHRHCSVDLSFLLNCETHFSISFPTTYVCLRIRFSHSEQLFKLFKANWYRAAQYCRQHGMHLVSISSQEENYRLEKLIKDVGEPKSSTCVVICRIDNFFRGRNTSMGREQFWTSGTDLASEGNFFWMLKIVQRSQQSGCGSTLGRIQTLTGPNEGK